MASKDSHVTGTNGFVVGSVRGQAAGGSQSGVIGSYNTINPNANSTVWGWGSGSTPSSANRKIELHAKEGTIKAAGGVTGSSTFSDYAEYFESLRGKRFRREHLSHLKVIRSGRLKKVTSCLGSFPRPPE